MKMRTGAKAIVDALRRSGVDCVFGLPGTQNLALFEALRKSGLRLVVATSEMSAAMMANGYYRASGRPGVLLTIPGPGFTWALTGFTEASLDSAALLHITSTPATSPGHSFQLQAIDQTAMARPVARRIIAVEYANDVDAAITAAWQACRSDEPGPVLVQIARGAWEQVAKAHGKQTDTQAVAARIDVSGVAAELTGARRCLLLLGQGCHDAAQEATELAERLQALVVTTTSGRGAVAEDHPLSLGFALAGNDTGVLNTLIESSDRILAIGCKFSHNGSRGFRLRIPMEKLIHVDASRDALNANYPARVAIKAEAGAFLRALLDEIPEKRDAGFTPEEAADWRARCTEEKLRDRTEPRIQGTHEATPKAFFAALRAAMPRTSCLVTDSGRHQELARRYYPILCPRGLVTPTNLQSMGFGISAATGAKLADPRRTVVALIGDGGLAMSGLELLTAVRERLDLTVIVFVDGAYAAIRDQQVLNYGRSSGTVCPGPDCAALAAAVGATHVRLDGDAEAMLRSTLVSSGVNLVEVVVGDSIPMRVRHAQAFGRATLRHALGSWLHRRHRG